MKKPSLGYQININLPSTAEKVNKNLIPQEQAPGTNAYIYWVETVRETINEVKRCFTM
jgi:hypothetical protein